MIAFPDAAYVVLSSRLIPDLDGGYTIATLARARQMADAGVDGGRGPLLLTVDPGTPADHAAHRAEFVARGAAASAHRFRNLFDEAADPHGGAADWLRGAAHPGDRDPALEYRSITDAEGRPTVDLPVIAGDPDWHLTAAPVAVRDRHGAIAGVVEGFGALYLAWLRHVVTQLRAHDPERLVVVVCEGRQLGELLVGWDDPGVRIVHAIHTIHLEPPFTADAPVNALWSRWLGVADRFDAVLWPTASQRADVEARFGASPVHRVAPHGVAAVDPVPGAEAGRVAGRVVMLNRLAPGKRVDHAIRAFARVADAVPAAHLDIWGEGPERAALQTLVDDLAVGERVRLRGLTGAPGEVLDAASAFLSTSAFEGQGLAIAEALAHGCPAVAYDINYGPRDLLRAGGGLLVPDGDIEALADALIEVLTDAGLHRRLAAEALVAAEATQPERAMSALAEAVRGAVSRPSRRAAG